MPSVFEVGDQLEEFVVAWKNRWDHYVFGESGQGKSFTFKYLAAITHERLWSVACNGDASVNDLLGYKEIVNGNTVFNWGALPRSMQEGETLLLEEMDRLAPRMTTVLHNAMSDRELYLPESGEWVKAKPGWCIKATGNTNGKGDTSGRFVSAEVLDSALLRRFRMKTHITVLSVDKQKDMIKKMFPGQYTDQQITKIVETSEKLRASFNNDQSYGYFGIADMVNWAEQMMYFTPGKAFLLAYGNSLDKQESMALFNNVEATMGKDMLKKPILTVQKPRP